MAKIIRLTESDLTRIVKRVISEQQSGRNPDERKIIDYVMKQWGLLGKDNAIDQNSAQITITNKNGSKIIMNIQKGVIEYDKNLAIDPTPISIKSTFDQFKKWFDNNNNYNPLSGAI